MEPRPAEVAHSPVYEFRHRTKLASAACLPRASPPRWSEGGLMVNQEGVALLDVPVV